MLLLLILSIVTSIVGLFLVTTPFVYIFRINRKK